MPILTAERTAEFMPAHGAPMFMTATLMLLWESETGTGFKMEGGGESRVEGVQLVFSFQSPLRLAG